MSYTVDPRVVLLIDLSRYQVMAAKGAVMGSVPGKGMKGHDSHKGANMSKGMNMKGGGGGNTGYGGGKGW